MEQSDAFDQHPILTTINFFKHIFVIPKRSRWENGMKSRLQSKWARREVEIDIEVKSKAQLFEN